MSAFSNLALSAGEDRYTSSDVVDVQSRSNRCYDIENENFAAGCFGSISLARHTVSKSEVVIKKLSKSKCNPTEVRREINAGKILKHPNIAKFHEHFSDDEADYLVFDRIHGVDLFNTIEKRKFVPFKDTEAKKIFKQILKAIQYAHKNNVVNRDIKLENILMDSDFKVTVIDWGLCDIVKDNQLSEKFCGSIDYVAPEVLCNSNYNGFLADSFSLGVVLYTLLYAEFPFIANNRVNALRNKQPHPKPIFNASKTEKYKIHNNARDLVTKMLNPDPSKRLTLDQVKSHPWLKKSILSW